MSALDLSGIPGISIKTPFRDQYTFNENEVCTDSTLIGFAFGDKSCTAEVHLALHADGWKNSVKWEIKDEAHGRLPHILGETFPTPIRALVDALRSINWKFISSKKVPEPVTVALARYLKALVQIQNSTSPIPDTTNNQSMKTASVPKAKAATKPSKPAAADTAQQIQQIGLELIDASALNPRTEFNQDYIENELAPSIKSLGILQPLIVRPILGQETGCYYEVVVGECRRRAAAIAGLKTVPCIVRNIDDLTFQKLALTENLQRKDLSILEEGRAFKRLLDSGELIAGIEKEFGIKRSAIYGRIKLTELCELGLDALAAGNLSASVALRIARIPGTESQVKCVKRILDFPHLYKDAKAAELIASEFMVELKTAPFDRKDATLNPARGCCDKCTFRTGNQADLFGAEMKGRADVCTDPPCYAAKCAAGITKQLEAHSQIGGPVLRGDDAKKVAHHGSLAWNAPFYDLSEPFPEQDAEDETPLGDLLKKLIPQSDITCIETPVHTGGSVVIEAVSKELVHDLIKKGKLKLPEPEQEPEPEPGQTEEEIAAQRQESQFQEQFRTHFAEKIVLKIERTAFNAGRERTLLTRMLLQTLDGCDFDEIAIRRNWYLGETNDDWAPHVTKLDITDLFALAVEINLHLIGFNGWNVKTFHAFAAPIAALYDLDPAKLEATFRAKQPAAS